MPPCRDFHLVGLECTHQACRFRHEAVTRMEEKDFRALMEHNMKTRKAYLNPALQNVNSMMEKMKPYAKLFPPVAGVFF